ncbi:MAG: hypothetical protein V8T45_11110 [Oscillospiraceae bacterium]
MASPIWTVFAHSVGVPLAQSGAEQLVFDLLQLLDEVIVAPAYIGYIITGISHGTLQPVLGIGQLIGVYAVI